MESLLQNEKKSLFSRYMRYTAATVTSLLVYSLYSVVDGLFVSHGVNAYAMSAVNLALPYTNLLFSLAVLFAVGTGTVLAVYLGQNKKEEANRLFSQNTLLLTVLGVAVSVLLFCFLTPVTELLGADGVTFDYTRDYLKGLAPFSVFFILSYNMEILIKTDGYPEKAFKTVVAGCLINCVLDYITVFPLQMGVYGAALATGISQLCVCCIYFFHFMKEKTTFHFSRFHFDAGIYKRIIPLGLSDGLTEVCNGLMLFLFNRTVQSTLGAEGLVSYTVIAYIHTVVINAFIGFSSAGQPLISFYHGKKQPENSKKVFRYTLLSSGIFGIFIFALLLIFAVFVVKLFSQDATTAFIESSAGALRRYAACYLVAGYNIAAAGFLTAIERPKGAMAVSLGRGFVLQALALFVLSKYIGGNAIWFTPSVSEIVCLIISAGIIARIKAAADG